MLLTKIRYLAVKFGFDSELIPANSNFPKDLFMKYTTASRLEIFFFLNCGEFFFKLLAYSCPSLKIKEKHNGNISTLLHYVY